MHLVPGSFIFLNDQHNMLQNKRYMMIISEHKTYRKLPSSNVDWKQITHYSCGGTTAYSTLYTTSEVNYVAQTTILWQSLLHCLDHTVHPTLFKVPKNHLETNKLVPVHLLHLPVGYQTSFMASGWGSHTLTEGEKGKLWGLRTPLTFTKPLLIPVDILRALLGGLSHTTPVVHPFNKHRKTPPIHVKDPNDARTVSLNRLLPHLRQEDVKAMVSTKADSAQTPLIFWNNRISLLFPSFAPRILDVLRTA